MSNVFAITFSFVLFHTTNSMLLLLVLITITFANGTKFRRDTTGCGQINWIWMSIEFVPDFNQIDPNLYNSLNTVWDDIKSDFGQMFSVRKRQNTILLPSLCIHENQLYTKTGSDECVSPKKCYPYNNICKINTASYAADLKYVESCRDNPGQMNTEPKHTSSNNFFIFVIKTGCGSDSVGAMAAKCKLRNGQACFPLTRFAIIDVCKTVPTHNNYLTRNSLYHEMIHTIGSFGVVSANPAGGNIDCENSKILSTEDCKKYFSWIYIAEYHNQPIIQLSSPKVLAAAKKYYNCDSVTGLRLHSISIEGSTSITWYHLDERYVGYEVMAPEGFPTPHVFISPMTLAALEDFQLVKVTENWQRLGTHFKELPFGRHKGCDFLNLHCEEWRTREDNDEFCFQKSGTKCVFDDAYVATCKRNILSRQTCWLASISEDCQANQQVCVLVMGKEHKTRKCISYYCKATNLILEIDGSEHECSKTGTGKKRWHVCPKAKTVRKLCGNDLPSRQNPGSGNNENEADAETSAKPNSKPNPKPNSKSDTESDSENDGLNVAIILIIIFCLLIIIAVIVVLVIIRVKRRNVSKRSQTMYKDVGGGKMVKRMKKVQPKNGKKAPTMKVKVKRTVVKKE